MLSGVAAKSERPYAESGLARLRRAAADTVGALDPSRVWALASALRRVNSPWGDVLGEASPINGRAPCWQQVRAHLDALTAHDWDDDLEALTRALLDRAGLTERTPLAAWLDGVAQGWSCPALRLVNTLDCNDVSQLTQRAFSAWDSEEWGALFACTDLRYLRSLSMMLRVPHLSIWSAVMNSAWLHELTSLTLCSLRTDHGMSDAQGATLIARPWVRLQRLRLDNHHLTDGAIQALCRNQYVNQLHDLSIYESPLTDGNIRALISAPWCQRLTRIHLSERSAEPVLDWLSDADAAVNIPDAVLRWVLLSHNPDDIFPHALHPAVFHRVAARLSDLIACAPAEHEAALLLTHLCENGLPSLRAAVSALNPLQIEILLGRICETEFLRSRVGWCGYLLWTLLPQDAVKRAEALLKVLGGRHKARYFPWGVLPDGDGSGQLLSVRLLQDLCAMPLSGSLASQRLAALRTLSKGHLSDPLAFEAHIWLCTLSDDSAALDTLASHLRDHFRDAKSPSLQVMKLSTRVHFPAQALRSIAHATLTARSERLRVWGFTTLCAHDVYDEISRDAFLIARTMMTHRDGAPLLEALRNGWLPRCLDALERDRFTAADARRFPTLRALQGAPLRRVLSAHQ